MATNLDEIAREVIAGKYGNGAERQTALTNAGYDYNQVQGAVNTLLGGGSVTGTANIGVSGGGSSGGSSVGGSSVSDYQSQINNISSQLNNLQNSSYNSNYADQINSLTNQYNNINANDVYNSQYIDQINNLTNKYNNMSFDYDYNNDDTYKQYEKEYTEAGKQAMNDAYGNIAARTGGLGSSYALYASQQAYNQYMQQLASKIPELKKLAYELYQSERNGVQDQISNLVNLDTNAKDTWKANHDYTLSTLKNQLANLKELDDSDYNKWLNSRDAQETTLRNNLNMYQSLLDAANAATAKASTGTTGKTGNTSNDDEYEWVEWDPVKEGVSGANNTIKKLLNGFGL